MSLLEQLGERPFCIEPDQIDQLLINNDRTLTELMVELIPLAQDFARAPISGFPVGAVGLTDRGALLLGVNLEFPGLALNQSVHSEQFLVARAMTLGETSLTALALSAPPCGHCRQFLKELNNASDLSIYSPSGTGVKLEALLPDSFGPEDLGVRGCLLRSPLVRLENEPDDELAQKAWQAARQSYCPYSNCPSGVALRVGEKVFTGSYAENAAFNPSLSPLQSALTGLVADGLPFSAVTEAVLVERHQADLGASQASATRTLLASLNPEAQLRVVRTSA